MKKIILASGSPRRKKILEQIGLKFSVEKSNYEEKRIADSPPSQIVEFLSLEKANLLAVKYEDAIIIGADTLVVLNGEILGKPKSEEDAGEMLRKLRNKTHTVVTGFTVLDTKSGRSVTKHVETKVKFKDLSEMEISAYVETGEPMDKAGGYGIQDKGGLFIEEMDGDYFNIVGLPLFAVSETLREFGIDITEAWK